LSKSPEFAAKLCEKESGFPYEVCVNVIKNTKWDSKLKEEDIKIFENNYEHGKIMIGHIYFIKCEDMIWRNYI